MFQIAASGVPLNKIVIGKPANTGDASNGFIDTTTLAGCLAQAKSQGWNAGAMVWEVKIEVPFDKLMYFLTFEISSQMLILHGFRPCVLKRSRNKLTERECNGGTKSIVSHIFRRFLHSNVLLHWFYTTRLCLFECSFFWRCVVLIKRQAGRCATYFIR